MKSLDAQIHSVSLCWTSDRISIDLDCFSAAFGHDISAPYRSDDRIRFFVEASDFAVVLAKRWVVANRYALSAVVVKFHFALCSTNFALCS